jgi:tRNA U34 5-carboxymethylaminomethyl modifying enzyme MnmG/GidA
MLQKMIWTKKFWNKPKSSQVFWLHRKERNNADKLLRLEDVKYQRILIMKKIKSMSIEAKQKLSKIRPVTISQASRISGFTK